MFNRSMLVLSISGIFAGVFMMGYNCNQLLN